MPVSETEYMETLSGVNSLLKNVPKSDHVAMGILSRDHREDLCEKCRALGKACSGVPPTYKPVRGSSSTQDPSGVGEGSTVLKSINLMDIVFDSLAKAVVNPSPRRKRRSSSQSDMENATDISKPKPPIFTAAAIPMTSGFEILNELSDPELAEQSEISRQRPKPSTATEETLISSDHETLFEFTRQLQRQLEDRELRDQDRQDQMQQKIDDVCGILIVAVMVMAGIWAINAII